MAGLVSPRWVLGAPSTCSFIRKEALLPDGTSCENRDSVLSSPWYLAATPAYGDTVTQQ